ncbi:MAG: cellulase family glycosylhydrolase [Bacteroidales bacterium]|nr:cellulase family glycosylhydrolase [Bacteroidales bacterium]
MKPCNTFIWALFALLISLTLSCGPGKNAPGKEQTAGSSVWSIEKAQEWGKTQPWLRGSNFQPSSAINQLEMWQAETFDPETIDRELGWAAAIGFNCMRVYLHHLAWEIDSEGFKLRMADYLAIADKHGIKTIFVFFDDCWNPEYQAGRQPDPRPGIHNSGWVRDPGDLLFSKPELIDVLEAYVKDVLAAFKDDKRIVIWDLYNEPGNSGYGNKSLPLLQKVFEWGREVNPSQPLSCGVWKNDLKELNAFQVANSDVITYHNYSDAANHQVMIDTLKLHNRPLVCTEYMARKNNSLFATIMPMLKEQNIGAINWGLVSGKTNTIYAWGTPIPDGSEPALWFHDIFRRDGSVYKQEEVDVIKKLTGVQ